MNIHKIFALILLITLQTQTATAAHTLPNTNLRVIGLVTAGAVITGIGLTILKTIVDKIIEDDPTITETTLRRKITTILRYSYGTVIGFAATASGLALIANCDNEYLIN